MSTMQDGEQGLQRVRPFLDIAARRIAKSKEDKEAKTVEEKNKPLGAAPEPEEVTPDHDDDQASPEGVAQIHEAPAGDAAAETTTTTVEKTTIHRDYEIAKSIEKKRYTLGPLYVPDYVDAHGEYTSSDIIEEAAWDYVRQGNREINLQHSGQRAGEWVGLLTWPFPAEVELHLPENGIMKSKKVKFPPGTPFMGVIWDEWAWDKYVEPGLIRGFSMEGWGTRVRVSEENE